MPLRPCSPRIEAVALARRTGRPQRLRSAASGFEQAAVLKGRYGALHIVSASNLTDQFWDRARNRIAREQQREDGAEPQSSAASRPAWDLAASEGSAFWCQAGGC